VIGCNAVGVSHRENAFKRDESGAQAKVEMKYNRYYMLIKSNLWMQTKTIPTKQTQITKSSYPLSATATATL